MKVQDIVQICWDQFCECKGKPEKVMTILIYKGGEVLDREIDICKHCEKIISISF